MNDQEGSGLIIQVEGLLAKAPQGEPLIVSRSLRRTVTVVPEGLDIGGESLLHGENPVERCARVHPVVLIDGQHALPESPRRRRMIVRSKVIGGDGQGTHKLGEAVV